MRKGFYFSFDAIVALTLLGFTTVLLLWSSAPTQSTGDITTETFRKTNTLAEDSVQMASRSSLGQAFTQEEVEHYINDTELEKEDSEKSVMDVISVLWASKDTEAAKNISKEFFDGIISDGYGYRVSISGDEDTLIFNSSRLNTSEALAKSQRIVSGVQKNQPQEGYLSRARAEQVDKNTTEVFEIPMGGSAVSGGTSNSLDLTRHFELDAEDIQNATLFLSIRTGGSDPNSIDVQVNGQDADFPSTWDYEVDKEGNHLLFHKEQVTDMLQKGWNSIYVSAKNTASNKEVDGAVQLNPGSRVSVTYRSNQTGNISTMFSDRKYFTNIETEGHQNTPHGVWQVMSYYVPDDADVKDVALQLSARDVDEISNRNETQVWLNDELVNATSICTSEAPGQCDGEQDIDFRYNLTNHTDTGTNVVTVYIDTFLNDNGSISGFGDDNHIELYSDPETSPSESSYLEYEYERSRSNLVFGKIELARTERFGGIRSNPKTYNTTFQKNVSLLSTFTHLAQLDSQNVTVKAEYGGEQVAFQSPREFITPTDISIPPEFFDITTENNVTISDECTNKCDVLPETTFERRLLIKSQVPYGDTFQNRSSAQEDAEERLNKTLGEFVDATEIASDTLSINNVPWLFGPVTFELEVWKE
ncbi:MAG: hypothetical protein MUP63_00150 [Candidatus Nanohaloarchaeota archaeon QJJ-7]|nr:hypothetical protein [Candidatus Nanohaloarchaeota archaeon QJJ-7]